VARAGRAILSFKLTGPKVGDEETGDGKEHTDENGCSGEKLRSKASVLKVQRSSDRQCGPVLIGFSRLFSRFIGAELTLSIEPIVDILSGRGLFRLGQHANRDVNILAMVTALNAVMDRVRLVQSARLVVASCAGTRRSSPPPNLTAVWILLAALTLGIVFGTFHTLHRGR